MPCAVRMWQKSSAPLNKYYRLIEKPVGYILQLSVSEGLTEGSK